MQPRRIAALSTVVAVAILSAGSALAHVPDVKVFRAGQPIGIIETREAAVQVFRGVPVARKGDEAAQPGATAPSVRAISAGANLWLVDAEGGAVSVCRLAKTTQVGEHRIDCETGLLPR